MTGLVAFKAFADRYALSVQVGVLKFQVLDVPESCPLLWGFASFVGQHVSKVNVVGAKCLPLELSGEVRHVFLVC